MRQPIEIWDPADYAVYAFNRVGDIVLDDDVAREDIEQALQDLDRTYRACKALGVIAFMWGDVGDEHSVEEQYLHSRDTLQSAFETARPKDEPPPPPRELPWRTIIAAHEGQGADAIDFTQLEGPYVHDTGWTFNITVEATGDVNARRVFIDGEDSHYTVERTPTTWRAHSANPRKPDHEADDWGPILYHVVFWSDDEMNDEMMAEDAND